MTELSDDELNKRVHEIMGLCRHGWKGTITRYNCDCMDTSKYIRDLLNFTGDWKTSAYEFGMMFEFMQKHEQAEKFRNYVWAKKIGHGDWADDLTDAEAYPLSVISPRPFAEAMVRFFEEAKL